MVEHRHSLDRPEPHPVAPFAADHDEVRQIIDHVRSEARLQLSEAEGKGILKAYGIATPMEGIARDLKRALDLAESIGYRW